MAWVNALAGQIVKINFRLTKICPLLYFGCYFWPIWPILAYFGSDLADFGRFWPPEPPQGGFCVFWGCPGVFPGGSQRIGRLNQ